MHALLAFNGRCFGVSCSQVRTPGLGSSMWDLDLLFLIENSAVVIIFPFMSDIYLPGYVCINTSISLYLSHCGSFFICLAVETLFCCFQVVLIGNCSVNTCHFCVPMGGCQLRVFLLHHLCHQPRGLFHLAALHHSSLMLPFPNILTIFLQYSQANSPILFSLMSMVGSPLLYS